MQREPTDTRLYWKGVDRNFKISWPAGCVILYYEADDNWEENWYYFNTVNKNTNRQCTECEN